VTSAWWKNAMRKALNSAPHVITTYLATLISMLYATHEPITTKLIVSLIPAAAVAALRAAESAAAVSRKG
jgi:hypothetical protein